MRDRLIHGYRNVDLNLVWRTAVACTPEAEADILSLRDRLDAAAGHET